MWHPQSEPTDSSDSSDPSESRRWRERGQAIVLVLIAVALIAAVAVAMASVAARMTDRSAAQAAADASALAGAVSGFEAAAAVAERNGGRLVSFQLERDGVDVTVSVRVQLAGEVASAKASTAWRSVP